MAHLLFSLSWTCCIRSILLLNIVIKIDQSRHQLVHVGSMVKEQLKGLRLAVLAGSKQGRAILGIHRVDIDVPPQEFVKQKSTQKMDQTLVAKQGQQSVSET